MSKSRIVVAAAACVLVVSTVSGSLAGGAPEPNPIRQLGSLRAMFDVGVPAPQSAADGRATGGLKIWSRTVSDGGSFTYRMVGKNPFVLQTLPRTTIKTPLVPLIIKFSNGDTWDPTVGDSCDTASAVTRTLTSPMVVSKGWKFGGTSVGRGQYSDAFQRAGFYSQTKPTGLNPDYHVRLAYSLQPAITVNVPDTAAAESSILCGNGKLGAIEINWLDNYLQSTILPQLVAQGFGNRTFPIFLLGNVVEYIDTTDNCCALGYHSATSTARTAQTYAVAMYDNTGVFVGSGDVLPLSHEVAEWMDDPFTDNATRPWGNTGQVSGCQADLEVGDPLTGTGKTVSMSGKLYHLQELAFASWFYHEAPSTGVNGWYSNLGAFKTSAAPCF